MAKVVPLRLPVWLSVGKNDFRSGKDNGIMIQEEKDMELSFRAFCMQRFRNASIMEDVSRGGKQEERFICTAMVTYDNQLLQQIVRL